MKTEKRFFVKYKTQLGHAFCILFAEADLRNPDDQFPPVEDFWSMRLVTAQEQIIYSKEIPREFWEYSLDDYIAFFEEGIKPKRRIKSA